MNEKKDKGFEDVERCFSLSDELEEIFEKIFKSEIPVEVVQDNGEAVVVVYGNITATPTQKQAEGLLGMHPINVWNLDIAHEIVNYPHEPDDVELEEVGQFSRHKLIHEICRILVFHDVSIVMENMYYEQAYKEIDEEAKDNRQT